MPKPATNLIDDGDTIADFRMLSRHEVVALTGISYVTLWKMMRAGTFPRSRQCGGQVRWLQHEIRSWLAGRPVAVLKGDEPNPETMTKRFGRGQKR